VADPGKVSEISGGDVIVVKEDSRVPHVRGVLLVGLTGGGLLALHAFVEMTEENRIAADVLGAVMLAVFVGIWIYEVRHPARLEISHDSIVQRRRGRASAAAIHRTTGDLTFEVRTMVLGGHGAVAPVLAIPGDERSQIGIADYDRTRVKQACVSVGWRFADPED
jgi:hypothetical protein